jgi:hypothetical protein
MVNTQYSKLMLVPMEYPSPFPKVLGAFRVDPVIWIGHSFLAPGNLTIPINSSNPRWAGAFIPHIYSCEHKLTNNTVLFNHTSNQQNTKVLKREYLDLRINTFLIGGVDANVGTKDNITATPVENYIGLQEVQSYRKTSACHFLRLQFRKFINGTIDLSNT